MPDFVPWLIGVILYAAFAALFWIINRNIVRDQDERLFRLYSGVFAVISILIAVVAVLELTGD